MSHLDLPHYAVCKYLLLYCLKQLLRQKKNVLNRGKPFIIKYEDIATQSSIQSIYWFIRLYIRTCVEMGGHHVFIMLYFNTLQHIHRVN